MCPDLNQTICRIKQWFSFFSITIIIISCAEVSFPLYWGIWLQVKIMGGAGYNSPVISAIAYSTASCVQKYFPPGWSSTAPGLPETVFTFCCFPVSYCHSLPQNHFISRSEVQGQPWYTVSLTPTCNTCNLSCLKKQILKRSLNI